MEPSPSREGNRSSASQEILRIWFITAFTSARQVSLSWARIIQFIPPHPTSWRLILILFSNVCLSFVKYFVTSLSFYGEDLLASRPTAKLEDHPMSAVRDCLFNTFAATLHIWRPFLHPQPEDAPCRGDRDRHSYIKCIIHTYIHMYCTYTHTSTTNIYTQT
jgi:hypothetical protein